MIRRFVIIGCALLGFALAVTVLVWFLLQDTLQVEIAPTLRSEEDAAAHATQTAPAVRE